jgi:hypothetical protein
MTAMMVERPGMGMPTMGMPGSTGMMGGTAGATTGMNMMMVPRCKMKFEKCTGGMKVHCVCEDKVSAGMLQNLCTMMAGGMFSCCMMMNGMTACCCNMTMGMCKCEATEMGVTMTCTSGDKECAAMIQACCECCATMMKSGCTCCMMVSNMPVCCGC